MTPDARATALTIAVLGGLVAFLVLAVVAYYVALREPDPHRATASRHLRVVERRHGLALRREWLPWIAGLVVRFYRHEDGGPKAGVVLASLFLIFSVLIGANQ